MSGGRQRTVGWTVGLLLLARVTASAQGEPIVMEHQVAQDAVDAKTMVERFINARTSGSMDEFLIAVDMVKRRAEEGQPFFRYLLALYAPQEPLCALPKEKIAAYLKEGRPNVLRLAQNDHPMAQYLIGLESLFHGKNISEAVTWFERAARQESALAQNTLGLMYYTGNGVEKDVHRAALYFRQAAASGDMNGEYNLGTL